MSMMSLLLLILSVLPLTCNGSCPELEECQYDMETYANAKAMGDIPTLCNLLVSSVECIETSQAACQPDAAIMKQVEADKKELEAFCPGSNGLNGQAETVPVQRGAIPEEATCGDISSCMFDMAQFQDAINSNRISEACALFYPSVKCLRSALKDCQSNKMIEGDVAQILVEEKLLQEHCDDHLQDNHETDECPGCNDKAGSDQRMSKNEGAVNAKTGRQYNTVQEKGSDSDGNSSITNTFSFMTFFCVLCFGGLFQYI